MLIAVAGMALVFAGVAFAEYAARDLLLSRGDLLQSNQLHLYFRVNSLFYDPNLFGRDLALALVALGAYLAWARGTRLPIVAAIVSGILLGALALSYSITSFGALLAGLLVVAALRWSVRWALAGGAAILVCGAVFLLVSGTGHTDVGSAESEQHDDERQGGPGRGVGSRWLGTARSGAGARGRSAPRSPATSNARRRPSPTPSRSRSRPSRGGSGWSSTWRSWSSH